MELHNHRIYFQGREKAIKGFSHESTLVCVLVQHVHGNTVGKD